MMRWFRRRPEPETGRLTPEQATAIASAAAPDHWRDLMVRAQLQRVDDALCWTVSSATIGSGFVVTIDDATGAVIEARHWGVR